MSTTKKIGPMPSGDRPVSEKGTPRLRNDFLREMANTAGQLARLQRENDTVRRRMDDILRCNARLATMLHQQGRLLNEMSERLNGIEQPGRSWFRRWLERWRKAA